MALNIGYLTAEQDQASNECYTPFYAVEPLLEFIPKDKVIWCPFDEDWSAFYQTFKEQGYQVIRSSLKDQQDFFAYEPDTHWDILVSNPPFTLKDKILERVYSFQKPFTLLLPANAIQGKKRFPLFQQGLELLCFDGRIGYHMHQNFDCYQKGTAFASAYFCKDLLPERLMLRPLKEYQRSLIK